MIVWYGQPSPRKSGKQGRVYLYMYTPVIAPQEIRKQTQCKNKKFLVKKVSKNKTEIGTLNVRTFLNTKILLNSKKHFNTPKC